LFIITEYELSANQLYLVEFNKEWLSTLMNSIFFKDGKQFRCIGLAPEGNDFYSLQFKEIEDDVMH